MNPRVKSVRPKKNYTLILTFENNETKLFDVSPYLDQGIFVELKDPEYFKQVEATMGSVQWPHGQDFCPDTLFESSIACPPQYKKTLWLQR